MTCACAGCLRNNRFFEALERVDKKDKEFFESILDSLVNAEDHRDYYKAIVQNKWPGSKEILASYRG